MPDPQLPLTTRLDDSVFVLQYLRQSAREERSVNLMDVRAALVDALSGDFNDYLKFLRRFEYLLVDRFSHALTLTNLGERAALGLDRHFAARISEWFTDDTSGSTSFTPLLRLVDALPDDDIFTGRTVLARGPSSLTYRATHRALGRLVVVKELSVETSEPVREQFIQAVRTQASLSHPGIVQVHDLVVAESTVRAVFAHSEGGSLRDRIKQDGPLGLMQAIGAASQLLSALGSIHEAGNLHVDLEAENVLFDASDNVQIGDLSLAKKASGDVALHGAGVVFYEMLVGAPFEDGAPLPSLAGEGIPASLDEIVERLVAKNPENRYASADAALRALHVAFPRDTRASSGELRLRTST